MNRLVDALLKVEKSLSEEFGPLSLFALFLREDAPDRWDVVVSAPWIEKDNERWLRVISKSIQRVVKMPDLLRISRIVLVDPESADVKTINRAFHVSHSSIEVKDSNFFGLSIKHAYILSSIASVPVQDDADQRVTVMGRG